MTEPVSGGDESNAAQPSPAVSRATNENVARPSSAVSLARPTKAAYRRDLPHFQSPGQSVAIEFATWECWQIPEAVRSLVLDCSLHARGTRFELHAAVVMPDHVHMLLTPVCDEEGDTFGLSQVLNSIKGASSHAVNKALGRSGPVWQSESFDHVLRSDESIRATAEYICANPMRAGLVSAEDGYPWLWREWIEGAASDMSNRD